MSEPTIDDFRAGELADIRTEAYAVGESPHDVFADRCSALLLDHDQVDNMTTLQFMGIGARGRRLAIDGYDIEDPDESASFMICDLDEGEEHATIPASEARRVLAQLRAFVEDSVQGDFIEGREESDPAVQLAFDLRTQFSSFSRIKLFLITNRRLSGRERTFHSETLLGKPVEYHVWDLDRRFQEDVSSNKWDPIIASVGKWVERGLPVVRSPYVTEEMETYLTVLPGSMLADLYETYGSRLLEQNVRSYLSARGKVNRRVKETILGHPEKFIAYNNGVTATASSVEIDSEGHLREIVDLQIVNGGQTTASLYYTRKSSARGVSDLSLVGVPAKIVVVDPEVAVDLVPEISRYTNSQNAVSEADFFSNSPFHRRLEELSRRILTPTRPGDPYSTGWFYERTRGAYQNEINRGTVAESRQFKRRFPKSQLITKLDAAKYLVTWDQKPHVVSSGGQKNFLAFAASVSGRLGSDDTWVNEEYYKQLVCKAIIFRALRRRVLNADWYSKGYLANIVTYSIAKLAHDLGRERSRASIDWARIWRLQAAPEQVLDCLELYGRDVLAVLTDDGRPTQNVTEWAKKESCWTQVRAGRTHVDHSLSDWLVDETVVREKGRDASRIQAVDNSIGDQLKFVNADDRALRALLSFGQGVGRISPKETSIVNRCLAGQLPSPAQTGVLLRMLARLKENGFRDPYWDAA